MMPGWLVSAFELSLNIGKWLVPLLAGAVILSFVSDDRSYRMLRVWLRRRGPRRRYERAMIAIQTFADRRLGVREFRSRKALNFCLRLAVVYSFTSVLVGWSLDGPATMAGLPFVEEQGLISIARWLQVVIVLSLMGVLYVWHGFVPHLSETAASKARNMLERRLHKERVSTRLWARFVAATTNAVAFSAKLGTITVCGAGLPFALLIAVNAVLGFGLFGILVIFAVSLAVSGTFDVTDILLMALLGTVILFVGGAITLGLAILAIFLIIPLLNTVCDVLSLGVSRKLLRHLFPYTSSRPRLEVVAAHIAIDVAVAVLLLVLLTALLAGGAEALNWAYGGLVIPWREYGAAALRDPWSEGLAVTIALLSTLVWTVIHIALLLGALVAEVMTWLGHWLSRTTLLQDRMPSHPTRIAVVGTVATAVYIGLWGTLAIGGAIVWAAGTAGPSVGAILMEVANWSAGLFAVTLAR